MQFNQEKNIPKRSHVLNHPRPDELLSRLFHFLPVLLLLPLIITKSSVAADLSCFYIKHNTHTETDVCFFYLVFFPPPHPSFIPPIQPARIQEKAEIMRNWAGHREPPLLPLPSSSSSSSSSPWLCALRRGSYILFASRLIST